MAHAMGELDPAEVRDILQGQHVGRLTCQGADRAATVSVRYSAGDPHHVCVRMADMPCEALAQAEAPVQFEVDEVHGPARWSTVIGWGFVEKSVEHDDGGSAYRIRFTDLRGFYRGTRPTR